MTRPDVINEHCLLNKKTRRSPLNLIFIERLFVYLFAPTSTLEFENASKKCSSDIRRGRGGECVSDFICLTSTCILICV